MRGWVLVLAMIGAICEVAGALLALRELRKAAADARWFGASHPGSETSWDQLHKVGEAVNRLFVGNQRARATAVGLIVAGVVLAAIGDALSVLTS